MARAFGGNHDHINILGRHNRLEMDIKTVGETQALVGRQIRRDALLINSGLNFIRQRYDDQISLFDGLFNAEQFKPFFQRQTAVSRVAAVGHNHFNARIAQILAMSMTLRTKTKDCHCFTRQTGQRSIITIDHLQRLRHSVIPSLSTRQNTGTNVKVVMLMKRATGVKFIACVDDS